HTPAIGEDMVHLAYRPLGGALRDAVDGAVIGEEQRTICPVSSLPDEPGQQRYFEVVSFVQPPSTAAVGTVETVVLLIADVTGRERERHAHDLARAESESKAARIQELLDDSARTVRQLLQANQELATSNAGLQSANEELM